MARHRSARRGRRGESHSALAEVGGRWAARISAEVGGFLLLGASLLSLLALATYDPADPILELVPVANAAGVVGASMAGLLVRSVGAGSIVLIAAAAWFGGRLCLGRGLPGPTSRFWVGTGCLLLALAAGPVLLHELSPARFGPAPGSIVGSWLAVREQLLLSLWGALLVNGMILLAGVLSVTGFSLGNLLDGAGRAARAVGLLVLRALTASWDAVRAVSRAIGAAGITLYEGSEALGSRIARLPTDLQVWRERRARRLRVEASREPELPDEIAGEADGGSERTRGRPSARKRRAKSGEPDIVDHVPEQDSATDPVQEAFRFQDSDRAGRVPFRLPDSSLFQVPPAESRSYDRDSLLMNSRILEKKLLDFGVRGHVVRVHPGPVITMYEYEPASGVKVNKIVNLSDDLAMALRALSIRIIAPLPGKSVVGIEVPNAERETVYLRSLIEADGFRSQASKLSIAMGKDIFGNPVHADLARMPHLLVAGATGTGKSVFLNSLLCGVLCRATPDELKLLLVDPKLLELSVYEDIPHLIADVVTNPKRAAAALQGIVRMMERRYQMMSALQVRNIDQFNAKVDRELEKGATTFRLRPKPGDEEGEEVELERIPYIMVVIDELADLMVLAAKDVEESLQRLAQMARASGIHLVLATQRPSVDVLTGVIKANFPARVSFQVSTRTDSRTVLDQNGADNLLGQGDMLFLPPGTSRLQRIHSAFVSEKEVMELAAFLRDQGKPEFNEGLLRLEEESAKREERGEDVDEMFDRAVALVAETRNASISYVQRRLRIGYNRAARIVEQMESEGMVGAQEGTRPRDVFLPSADADL